MHAGIVTRSEPNVRVEMKAHRERLKQAVHPGVTQREAGYTPAQWTLLSAGVCDGLAGVTERGERIANRAVAALALLLALAIGAGVMQDRWAEKKHVPTVEAGR